MFGYIKPFKPEMKFKEFDEYKSIYCGFCKLLGNSYGSIYKLTLSYDFTFVALLSKAVDLTSPKTGKCKCMANPFVKKKCVMLEDNEILSSAAIMMLYMKLSDDISDNKVFKKAYYKILSLLVKPAYNKSVALYPELNKAFSKTIMRQNEVEKNKNLSIDAYSEPTSEGLAYLFSSITDDEINKRIFNRLGYLLGKFVYLVDALDDIEKDVKSSSFNPYIVNIEKKDLTSEFLKNKKETVVQSLNMLIGEVIATYELIDIQRYKEVLDNIMYFGLQNTVQLIIKQCNKKENGVTI